MTNLSDRRRHIDYLDPRCVNYLEHSHPGIDCGYEGHLSEGGAAARLFTLYRKGLRPLPVDWPLSEGVVSWY